MLAIKAMKKDLNYFLSLPYSKVVVKRNDEDGVHFIGKVLEIDGCMGDGKTESLAIDSLNDSLEAILESMLEHGDPIPEPVIEESYSGKFLVRMPKSLHRRLAVESQREGISLNQYALYKLSQ